MTQNRVLKSLKGKMNLYNTGIGTGGGDRGDAWPQHFNFRTKQGPTVSVSNIRDIAFYVCSEIIRTRNFKIFKEFKILSFGQFTAVFHFC